MPHREQHRAGSEDQVYSAADNDHVGRVPPRGGRTDIGAGAGSGNPAYNAVDKDVVAPG